MRIFYILTAVIILLGFAAMVVLLPFMPDQIPVHYDITGQVDRMGSPLELLVFPAMGLLTGVICICCALWDRRRGGGNEKVTLLAGICSVLVLNGMGVYYGITAIRYAQGTVTADAMLQISGLCMGVLLIMMGLLMPKTRRGSTFGLRTRWSVQNDVVWQKTQVAGSWLMTGAGAAMLLLSLVVSSPKVCMVGWVAILLMMTAAAYVMSYRIYKKYRLV